MSANQKLYFNLKKQLVYCFIKIKRIRSNQIRDLRAEVRLNTFYSRETRV